MDFRWLAQGENAMAIIDKLGLSGGILGYIIGDFFIEKIIDSIKMIFLKSRLQKINKGL